MRAINNAPSPLDEEYFNEMRALGFDEASIRKNRQQDVVAEFEVLEENWAALMWFIQTQDCYRFSESGVCLGLDLPQVLAEKQLSERQASAMDFNYLKDMARENTAILNGSLKKATNQVERQNDAPPD